MPESSPTESPPRIQDATPGLSTDTDQWAKYRSFMAEDKRDNVPGFQAYLDRLFGSIDLRGKRVLEIGSGRGLLSLYCALQGAEHVVSMEPEMDGSTQGVLAVQKSRIEQLGLDNIQVDASDFNQAKMEPGQFDVIIMIAVLNHLHETTSNAGNDQDAFRAFVGIAEHLYVILKPGGQIIATDACRYSAWTMARRLGWPRKLCLAQKTINWRIHQQPSVWRRIFTAANFDRCDFSYPTPHRLRMLEPLIANPVGNWALFGEFILHAHRK